MALLLAMANAGAHAAFFAAQLASSATRLFHTHDRALRLTEETMAEETMDLALAV
jgi:hypothetical protein